MIKGDKETGEIFVSVIMAVYNGEMYLRQAIDSVLKQTYKNFEFIIVNDGSVDNTAKIIRTYKDKRIRFIERKENRGLGYSLNEAVKAAHGKYLLRMDADDICFPDRFYKQVSYMEKRKDIILSFGSYLIYMDGKIKKQAVINDQKPDSLKSLLLFYNSIVHPCVIFRRELFEEFAYTKDYNVTEDFALWVKIVEKYKIAGQRECMILLRMHKQQVTNNYREQQSRQCIKIRHPYLLKLFGTVTEKEEDFHNRLSFRESTLPEEKVRKYLIRLKNANEKKKCYPKKEFIRTLLQIYVTIGSRKHSSCRKLAKGMLEIGRWQVFSFLLFLIKNIGEGRFYLWKGIGKARRQHLI